jgi:outer membrane protein assembly factor BamD (BamD/ComL family)
VIFAPRPLWVKGVAEHRLDKLEAARHALQNLVNEFPRHRLTEGARRHLAMAAEDAGDLGAALEQYLALDYMEDIAYFVDVLMTPEQLRAFIESHPRHERINELWYALGVRQLRSGRWMEAREAYARVKPAAGLSKWGDSSPDCYSNGDEHPCEEKETFYGEARRGVKHEWILRDLQTIDALEGFERRAADAHDDEQRAEALYQMASYLFEGSELVFYNPAAWQPSRYHNLTYLFTSGGFRAPGEVPRFWQHMREHSENSRALEIYLRIAREYPQTRAARDALYTAAVATEKLEAVGEWSELYATEFYKQGHGVTYTDVRRAYPSYQLPRGTLDWEPSTRTVGGGPGWSPKPKPAPRLSKFERGQRKAWAIYEQVTTPVANVWINTLRPPLVTFNSWVILGLRWVLAACAFACMLTMWRAAAWSRRVWRERVRWRAASDAGSLALRVAHGRKAHAKFLRRARRALDWDYRELRDAIHLKAFASYRFGVRRGRRALPTLAASSRRSLADSHERQLLALNALTHSAFIVLLITLLRLVR